MSVSRPCLGVGVVVAGAMLWAAGNFYLYDPAAPAVPRPMVVQDGRQQDYALLRSFAIDSPAVPTDTSRSQGSAP